MIKKIIAHTIGGSLILCAACMFLFCTCKPRGTVDHGHSARVMLLDAIPNDLAQVMILTRDVRGGNDQYIKDFYRAGETAAGTRAQMVRYMKSIKQYRGKLVVIQYNTNAAGNKTIIALNPAPR
ncbi:MAG TPA: hypothetical protein PLI62_11910 [Spirochaetota bacterium]|nr:hypothetical protein [Spirochaetota bacterium]HQP50067.1 hypothetical protein [Spirochaetota bacterium]